MALEALGVGADDEAVYEAVLQRLDLESAPSLAHLTGHQLRRSLRRLHEAGLVVHDRKNPLRPAVANPILALDRLIDRVEQRLLDQHRAVAAVRTAVTSFHALYVEGAPTTANAAGIEELFGVEAIRDKLAELAFFARESVLSIQPGGPQSVEAINASRPLDHRALRRGLVMRVVHDPAVLDDEVNRGYLRELTSLGVEARVAQKPADRMVIFDHEIAVVPVDPENTRAGALVVRQPGLVSGFIGLFERVWGEAAPVPWGTEDVESPSETTLKILTLLSKGHTDEAIARELNLSVRHLRRQISAAMQTLGASSRFEAGVEASRRGWI